MVELGLGSAAHPNGPEHRLIPAKEFVKTSWLRDQENGS
jgi:hypothetical protein